VKQFYANSEIERIFSRNAWLFTFRNGFCRERPAALFKELRSMDTATQREFSDLSIAASVARNSCRPTNWPSTGVDLKKVNNGVFLKPFSRSGARPRLLMVTPYTIWPAAHGGARRMVAFLEHLGNKFDIIVLTDEGMAYQRDKLRHLPGVTVMHLVDGRPDDHGSQDRIRRIRTHSHQALQMELNRLVRHYAVDLVQIEYVDLAGLVGVRTSDVPWFITLHDVLFSREGNSKADRFEAALLSRFSGVLACTEQDAKLVPRSHVTVIPNGVNVPTRPYQPSQGKQTILFAGPFRYRPNLEGIVSFLENVYPKLHKTFPALGIDILGGDEAVALARAKDCLKQPGVCVHPFTEDVQPFLQRCALTINPLCNTRGSSLKLIESLAHGRVCVSTRQGASGFAASELPGLVQVDRVQDFEDAIRWLLTHEGERLQRETPPPDLVTRFGWEHSAELQAAVYRQYLR
jgi:glycosyltransferase involved in cell wall biosynthesis